MERLVGVSEVAEMAGVNPSAVYNWHKHHANFPRPAVKLAQGPVWYREDIERWLKVKENRYHIFKARRKQE